MSTHKDTKEDLSYQGILDELLDKISRKGYDSLTPREREMLEEVSRNLDAQKERGEYGVKDDEEG